MNAYLIESLAPLVFRAGKPFGSQASAQDATFPLPSTGAGLIRYLALSQGKVAKSYQDSDYDKLLKLQCYGVYLSQFDENNEPVIFVPKPANSLFLENDNGEMQLIRLFPKSFDENCGSDLPNGLLYIQPNKDIKGKPKNTVQYWRLDDVIQWQNGVDLDYQKVADNGLKSIPIDIRTHNSIDGETKSVKDGDLFQTASFDLGYLRKKSENPKINPFDYFDNKRLGFIILSDEHLNDDLATMGGERRLSYFRALKDYALFSNSSLLNDINQTKGFSLTLISPAIFAKGYLPNWIDEKSFAVTLPSGASVKLTAVATERYQAVSGWDILGYNPNDKETNDKDSEDKDLKKPKWKPKATRKAVGAGSVYWFELANGATLSEEDLAFLSNPLSDNEFDKADGFGMAIVSAWQKA